MTWMGEDDKPGTLGILSGTGEYIFGSMAFHLLSADRRQVFPMRAEQSQVFVDFGVGAHVDRGLREITFCSMAMAGGNPLNGVSVLIRPRNWRIRSDSAALASEHIRYQKPTMIFPIPRHP